MNNRFMVSVAALALIAGTGLANAQGMNKESGGASAGASGGATMQQHSTQGESGSAKGSAKGSAETKGMTTGQASGQAEQKSSGEHAQSQTKSGEMNKSGENKPNEMNQRSEERSKGHESGQRAEENKGSKANQRAEERNKGNETNQRAEERNKGNETNMKAEGRENTRSGTAENKSTTERSTTTGQAGAGAKLSTEQRTKITSVIRNEHVAPENNVNFSIAVGTRVPRSGVTLHRLPTEVVSIYPEWRSYEYILVRDEIVVIDPATYEIVAVLNA